MSTKDGDAQEQVLDTEGESLIEQSGKPAGEDQETQRNEQEPEFITRAEAESLAQAAAEAALNKARSYADKGRVRAEKAAQEAKEMVEKMRSYGKDVSDDEEAEIVRAAKLKAIDMPDADDEVPENADSGQVVDQDFINAIHEHDIRMQERYGVTLDANDPEVKAMKVTGELEADKEAMEAAFAAKKARLTSEKKESDNSAPSIPPAVRVPGSGGGRPSGYDPSRPSIDYLEEANRRKR